jgi:hypothetical protein
MADMGHERQTQGEHKESAYPPIAIIERTLPDVSEVPTRGRLRGANKRPRFPQDVLTVSVPAQDYCSGVRSKIANLPHSG